MPHATLTSARLSSKLGPLARTGGDLLLTKTLTLPLFIVARLDETQNDFDSFAQLDAFAEQISGPSGQVTQAPTAPKPIPNTGAKISLRAEDGQFKFEAGTAADAAILKAFQEATGDASASA